MMKYLFALAGVLMATTAAASDLYVTGGLGTRVKGSSDAVVSLALGKETHKNLRVEAAYEHDTTDTIRGPASSKSNRFFAHALPQVQVPGTALTPYVLVGVGVDLESLDSRPLYALGSGLRVELTKSTDLDLRYRRVDNVNNGDKREVVSAGISLKF